MVAHRLQIKKNENTNIGYGRDVGYKFTQYDLGEDVHRISATQLRNNASKS